jgi:carbon catabolite-derepressing protein kinase
MDPRNALSPNALSPSGADSNINPFDAADPYGDDEEEEDEVDEDDSGLDFSTPTQPEEINTFSVLNSSLPEQLPAEHHLASYASARRAGGGTPNGSGASPAAASKEKRVQRTKWHFGIRSRSPPMEVMLEIYRTLRTLGMEWREKRDLGGLGGTPRQNGWRSLGKHIDRARDLDGYGHVDLKKAASIYFVEARARVQDVVVSDRTIS